MNIRIQAQYFFSELSRHAKTDKELNYTNPLSIYSKSSLNARFFHCGWLFKKENKEIKQTKIKKN